MTDHRDGEQAHQTDGGRVGDPAELGKRIAKRFMVRGERPPARDLAAQLGVEVVEREAPPPAQPQLRSEYQPASRAAGKPTPARIILYRDPIDLLAGAIHANQRFDMLACNLDEVHIAHELFHHLQAGQRFGPLRPEEVEAAAQSFTQYLLELAFDPDELSEMGPEL